MVPIVPSNSELFVQSGPGQGQTYSLSLLDSQPHGLLIGRLETCYIQFPPDARMIGREHACIVVRPEGVFLLGLHQNGTFVDGVLVGKGGQVELRYGARIQIGKDGPILVVHEQKQSGATAVPTSSSSNRTQYALPNTETDADMRAEIAALKEANSELDRQNRRLREEKETLERQLHSPNRAPSPPPTPSTSSTEARALFLRFSQGLLDAQKLLQTGELDPAALQGKLELLVFDLDDLHGLVNSH